MGKEPTLMTDTTTAVAAPVLDKKTIRERLKKNSAEDIAKATPKNELAAMAATLGVPTPSEELVKLTKPQIVEQMVKAAALPNPALRGKSVVEEPVAFVWWKCDTLAAAATAEKPMPRRKDVVDMLVKEGVAFYTARTQFQSWSRATNKGARRVKDLAPSDLPKVMRPEVPVTEAAAPAVKKAAKRRPAATQDEATSEE